MIEIGTYQNIKVIWIEYDELLGGKVPEGNWICLATSSKNKPNIADFEKFTRHAIENGILEFKSHGEYGEMLHDWFDETLVIMEVIENHSEVEIITTWHNNETLANTFWQCFFATCLPESTDYTNLRIVCTDLDGKDRKKELEKYIHQFQNGWLPNN